MTEAQQPQMPVQPSYEQFRDSLPGGEDGPNDPTVGTLWRASDNWRGYIREGEAKIDEDPDLSAEGKQKKKAELFERVGPKIERDATKAKEKAQQRAKNYAERAVPMPGGSLFGSVIKDTTELMAIQAEATSIAQMAKSGGLASKIQERTGKRPKNIQELGNPTLAALQGFFGEALEGTGFEAKIQAHATLRAARQLGIDPEQVYAPFRGERHEQALEEARIYQQAASMIPTSAPSADRGRVGGGHHFKKAGTPRSSASSAQAMFAGRKRRKQWK